MAVLKQGNSTVVDERFTLVFRLNTETIRAKKFFARLSLIMLFALLLIAGCSYPTHQSMTDHSNLSNTLVPKTGSYEVVKHLMGETQVPAHPQRVVVLHPSLLESAFALGVKPIAAPKSAVFQLQRLVGKLENIQDVSFESPNLESLLRLKPDLILGFSSHQNIYPLLSHIAPTVLTTFNPVTAWKDFLAFTARTLNKTKEAEQIMANYYARLAQFKALMGQRRQTTLVSVAWLRTDGFVLPQMASSSGVILKDAGVRRPLNQLLDSQTSIRRGGASVVYPLSRELLNEIDGDVLFLLGRDAMSNRNLNPLFQELKASPLWSKLKVVQLHQVHEVGFYWNQQGPIAVNRVIDDLFRYLVNQ